MITLETIEGIPKAQRFAVIGLILVAIIGLFFVYSYRPHHQQIQRLAKKMDDLERQIIVNKSLAEKKDELLAKNAELQERLLEVQQKLPTSSEVTDLLKQVSVLGQQAGLDIRLWKPRNKVRSASNLYYEIPVEIEVVGGYHDVGIFFDSVSKLPRIVNITDLAMAGAKGGTGILTKCVAKTFSAPGADKAAASQGGG